MEEEEEEEFTFEEPEEEPEDPKELGTVSREEFLKRRWDNEKGWYAFDEETERGRVFPNKKEALAFFLKSLLNGEKDIAISDQDEENWINWNGRITNFDKVKDKPGMFYVGEGRVKGGTQYQDYFDTLEDALVYSMVRDKTPFVTIYFNPSHPSHPSRRGPGEDYSYNVEVRGDLDATIEEDLLKYLATQVKEPKERAQLSDSPFNMPRY